MKPLRVIIIPVVLLPLLVLAGTRGRPLDPTRGGGVRWSNPPMATPNGWYWGYDNLETDPPFSDPLLGPIDDVDFVDITSTGTKIPPQNDVPFVYQLADSFWYYGQWYVPGDTLYISPDGWVSFDSTAAGGHPNPPNLDTPFPVTQDPNALMAVLWQDHDPTRDGGNVSNNRVYYLYDAASRTLIVEWYRVEARLSGNTYTFELMLSMGGQHKLLEEGPCGVVFSYHLIHFLYDDASAGWWADQLYEDGGTGIENQAGSYGITYDTDKLADHRVIRWGYKRIFKHDVQAYAFISPGAVVLRWTKIEPKVAVRNIGENAEDFSVTLDIYRTDNDSLVYHHSLDGFHLAPGTCDTMIGPDWRPEEVGDEYNKVAFTVLGRDSCRHNDTLEEISLVHCDDTLRYLWNWGDMTEEYAVKTARLGTFYGIHEGVLVRGGKVYVSSEPEPGYAHPCIEVWEGGSGCGAPSNGSTFKASAVTETYQKGWNRASFQEGGVWVSAGGPGGIWAAVTSASVSQNAGPFVGASQRVWGASLPCYLGQGPGRGGYWQGPSASGFAWGTYSGDLYTVPIELFVHLGFGEFPLSPQPSPPQYYDKPHDLTCFRMEEPTGDYIEADVPITPELLIANLGRAAEPYFGLFPVTFMVIDEETSDTVWRDSAVISHIGWLGDAADGKDTLEVTVGPWAPEGMCRDVDEGGPFRYYELVGLVRLGEVGPDESDHCPYNDTVKSNITCLLSHDVGATDMELDPPPDVPPDHYNPGTLITITVTVENFGFHEETDIPVHLEIRDVDSNDVLIWSVVQTVSFLDWRGNQDDNPWTAEVVFPPWEYPESRHHYCYIAFTELEDDLCPDDDYEIACLNTAPERSSEMDVPFALEAVAPNPFAGAATLAFSIPRACWVRLEVFDAGGRWVRTLENDLLEPGRYRRVWDGRDAAGRRVSAGVYLVKLEADEACIKRKVVILH